MTDKTTQNILTLILQFSSNITCVADVLSVHSPGVRGNRKKKIVSHKNSYTQKCMVKRQDIVTSTHFPKLQTTAGKV